MPKYFWSKGLPKCAGTVDRLPHSILLIMVIVLAAAVTALFSGSLETFRQESRFDSSVWRNSHAENEDDSLRLTMVDDLLHRYKLVGMTRKQIDRLLGKPSEYNSTDLEYVYWLGPERGFISIDSEMLCIKFKNDRVTEAAIRRD